jgi:outer membrane protein TolC
VCLLATLLPPAPLSASTVATVGTGPALAADQRPTLHGPLTLEQAVAVALQQSPVVRGAVAEVDAAVARLGSARANTRPIASANTFAAGGSLGNLFTTPAPVMPSMIQSVGPGTFLDQNIALMVPLYTGGRLRALVRQAEAAHRAAGAELETVRLEVATMTRIAYRQAQYQQALVGVQEATTTTHRERLRITQAAFAAEKVPQYYVLRDETELANAEQQLANTRRDAEQHMVQLKTWMGVSLTSNVQLTEPPRFEPVADVLLRLGVAAGGGEEGEKGRRGEGERIADVLPELLRRAQEQRPELAVARERVVGGHAGVQVARSLYRPQINAGAMADLMRQRGDTLGGTTFGVVASLPLLDGGQRRSQVREAEAEQRRIEAEQEKTILQIHQEVANAWLALQAAAQNVQTAETGRRSAQEDYRVTLIRYEAGKGLNVEVLDALAARTRAETNVAQALFEYGVAQDQLRRAVGQREEKVAK